MFSRCFNPDLQPWLLQSNTHVVLATLKRAPSELSSFARKTFKIDDHLGIAVSGLVADGRILSRYMRNETINHRCTVLASLTRFSPAAVCGTDSTRMPGSVR